MWRVESYVCEWVRLQKGSYLSRMRAGQAEDLWTFQHLKGRKSPSKEKPIDSKREVVSIRCHYKRSSWDER